MIAFVGSVFSPYYAWRRRRKGDDGAPAQAHNALNLSLQRRGRTSWTMTERGAAALVRTRERLVLGPSALHWRGDRLHVDVDERAAPWPRRVRGRVVLHPLALCDHVEWLDPGHRHRWSPIAPRARIEVDLPQPGTRWQGDAYLDCNWGAVPLARDFVSWDWSRAHLRGGSSAVVYDIRGRDGGVCTLTLGFDSAGRAQSRSAPPPAALPRSSWGLQRCTRGDDAQARLLHTLEDGPFYARSLAQARWWGEPVRTVHERLSLDRFIAPWVQAMLPFRMPRRG